MTRQHGEGTLFQRGDKWVAQASVGSDPITGRRVRITAYGATPREAMHQLELRVAAHDAIAPPSEYTVASWSKEWFRYLSVARGLKASTLQSYEEKLRLHVLPSIGDVRLEDVTGERIDHLVSAWAEAGMTPRMRQMCFGVLRSLLIYAAKKKRIKRSPHLDADDLAPAPKQVSPIWTDEERSKFLAWSNANSDLHALWATALTTGARLGELLGLHWSRVDWAGSAVTFDRQLNETKSGVVDRKQPLRPLKTARSVRTISVDAVTLQCLHALHADAGEPNDGWVFSNRYGEPLLRRNVLHVFQRQCHEAGVPVIRLHDLRHACASYLLKHGMAPDVVAARIGNSLEVMLSVYSHLSPAQHRAGAELAGQMVGSVGSGKGHGGG